MNNKSLAPLIVSFAAIILLTFIVINSRSTRDGVDDEISDSGIKNKLSLGAKKKSKISILQRPEREIVPDYSAEAVILIDKAKRKLNNDKIAEAEDELKTALVLDPENKTALSLLGGIFYRTERYKESEQMFRKLASIDKFENPVSLNKLASALAKTGNLPDAAKLCIRAQELDPSYADAYVNAAAIFAATGDSEKSIQNMRKAYELLRHGILPYCVDPVFDKVKAMPEFQDIISKARNDLENSGKSSVLSLPSSEKR